MVFGINLLPQDSRFFDLLCQTSELSNKCVHLVRDLALEENAEKAFTLGREVEINKQKAKEVTYELTELLCRALVTPFDHEDIHRLSRTLYKIPKICERTQEKIIGYEIHSYQNDLFKLTSNMIEVSDLIHDLMIKLRKFKEIKAIHDMCALINNIEANTDRLLNQLNINLTKNEPDVKVIIIRKEIYSLMESIVDRHRDVANIIIEIVLKHS